MKWIDDNHMKGEMSDEEFQKKVDEEARTRDMSRYGRDGSFVIYEERFKHLGVGFTIRINRYFQIGVPINQVQGMNDIAKWACLEYPKATVKLVDAIKGTDEYSEFLYKDTCHSHQKSWTLKRQVEDLVVEAFRDIESIPKILKDYKERSSKIIKALEKNMPLGMKTAPRKKR